MIKTLKRKFVVTAMLAITVFILLLLGGINAFFAVGNARQTDMLLESLMENRLHSEQPPAIAPFPGGNTEELPGLFAPRPGAEARHSAVHFSAVLTPDGGVLSVDVSRTATVDTDTARMMVRGAYGEGAVRGRVDGWKYAVAEDEDGNLLYIFLSTESARAAALRVMVISALLGALGWGMMLALVILLSGRAIRPIAENVEKQRRFVTDAGHELKTPLAIIRANTDAMELHTGESKWSRNIKEQTERLSGLMQNLLTLSKTDEGGKGLEKKALDVSVLLEETVRMFEAGMALKGLTYRQEIPPALCTDANDRLLSQLFSILLDNAVKYTPGGGKILLSLKKEEKGVLFFIENEVEALPKAAPEKLFDRFYRDDEARSRETGGYGIGLSAARAIAEAHGFRLSAEYIGDHTVRFLLKM